MIRSVEFGRDGVSRVLQVDRATVAECLAEVDAARAVLLRHVEAEKPAAAPLPTFDEWVAGRQRGSDTRHLHREGDVSNRTVCFGISTPDDVFALLPRDRCGHTPAESSLMIYDTTGQRDAALRDALLRLGKIRGDA